MCEVKIKHITVLCYHAITQDCINRRNASEVGLQLQFTASMKNDNTNECTHAPQGLCPSKHTNNVVKGKHNNELIVL